MAKPGIKSGAPARWPVIEILAPLGWTIRQIAAVIGCSEATVAKDLQRKGGMNTLWPDRPRKRAEVYTSTFTYWVKNREEMTDDLHLAMKQRLQIHGITEFNRGLMMGWRSLRAPGIPEFSLPDTDPYVSIIKAIAPRIYNEIEWISLLDSYLSSVSEGELPPPRNAAEVLQALKKQFGELSRSGLRSSNVKEFQLLLDRILNRLDNHGRDDAPLLTPREAAVLKMRYGFEGESPKTPNETATTFEMTRSRIQMIESKAIRKLRWARDNMGLLDSFATMETLRTQRDQAREELARLSAGYKALQASHQYICRVVLGGDPVAAQVVVQQELKHQGLNNPNLFRRCDELDLTVRTANILQNSGIEFIWQICIKTRDELLKLKHFGRKCAHELETILAELDLCLGMDKVKIELQATLSGHRLS